MSNDTRCNYAGELKVTDHLSKNSVRRRREAVSCETDKYELDLRFKPRHRDIIASDSECNTFKNWENYKPQWSNVPNDRVSVGKSLKPFQRLIM